jgi:hypothetical protein
MTSTVLIFHVLQLVLAVKYRVLYCDDPYPTVTLQIKPH